MEGKSELCQCCHHRPACGRPWLCFQCLAELGQVRSNPASNVSRESPTLESSALTPETKAMKQFCQQHLQVSAHQDQTLATMLRYMGV